MNPVSRVLRYFDAKVNLEQIRSVDLQHCTIEQMVQKVKTFANGFFAPMQVDSEIVETLNEIQKLRPKYIVEVGTARGGSLLFWTRVADPEATIVSISLPEGDFGGGSRLREPMFRKFPLPGQTLHLISGDSQKQETADLTRSYLKGNPADFLFIDADHTPTGVRNDYRLYSPLVRKGGIIAFHDIAIDDPEYGVGALWAELKTQHQSRSIVAEFRPNYGIGMLWV
jgi:predicted O-methyltransferase YrrM